MNKLRVGVIMGGRGNEREVSFNSGRTVCDHLDTFRYTIIPIFQRSNGTLYILPQRFLHRGKIADFEHRLSKEAEKITWDNLKELIDFMFIAMHGRYAEDGTIQGFLEILRIPYLGSKVFASALGMDKTFQKAILKSHGIRVPQGISLKPEQIKDYENNPEKLFNHLQENNLTFPLFVKPAQEGSSLGISAVSEKKGLIKALYEAAYVNPEPQPVLIEEFIKGMEFACITLTDYKTGDPLPLPPTEIVPEANSLFFDYEQKYMPGRATKFTPARCSGEAIKKIQETCIKTAQILGIENISRTDGFLTADGEVIIIDPNTISGMAPSSFLFRQAAEINMSHTKLINHLIETELARYGMLEKALQAATAHQESSLMNQAKKRVGVLLGGRSHEREISLESGRNIFYKLSPVKYEPTALFVDSKLELYAINQSLLVRNSTKEIELGLTPEMKVAWNDLPQLFDFIFIGLHGGEGENGCVQGTLEMLGVPYNGSGVLTSALCMDKFKTTDFLRSQGFDVPRNYLLSQKEWLANQEAALINLLNLQSGPGSFIIKPHDDGCSVLVQKANNEQEIIQAVEAIFGDGKDFALVEECITGMELTVGVMGNSKAQALPPSQAVATGGILSIEEKFLPGAGENQTPALLPADAIHFVMRKIEEVYTALNCKGYARIDCFYQSAEQSSTGSERLVIIEINTLPGMTPATCIFHQAAEIGLKPMEFIDIIVELGLEEQSRRVAVDSDSTHNYTIMSAPASPLEQ